MKDQLPKRLSYGDAAFFNFERDAMPMNVGSVGVYEDIISYPALLAHVDRRIDQMPRYRQRLVPVPLHVAHPVWIEDPRFDITRHVREVTLDPPGDRAQLVQLAAGFFAEPLARDRPLWELLVVHGLAGQRTAHVAKVHHCLVDGVAGVDLLAALLDLVPKAPMERRRERPAPPPMPSADRLFVDAFFDAMADQVRIGGQMALALADPLAAGKVMLDIARAFNSAGEYFAIPAPSTPWNHRLVSPSRLAWRSLPFEEVRHVARTLDGKINEVALSAVAGALGRFLRDLGEPAEGVELRVACPVNVRSDGEAGDLGNRISFMLLGVPIGPMDPLDRFARVHAASVAAKAAGQPTGVDTLMQIVGGLPAAQHALLGRTLSMPNTLANLICTNVPGPLVPLYCMGHRMIEHYPWVPLGWRMGLSVALMSYDREIGFSITGDQETPGDLDRLAAHLADCFEELRNAAGVDRRSDAVPPEMRVGAGAGPEGEESAAPAPAASEAGVPAVVS